jgi:hypothetical protein
MKSGFIIIALLALATVATARTPAAFEDAKEVEPSLLSLPSAAGGTLSFQKCSACRYRTYTLSESAHFYIDEREVSYAEFQRHVSANPNGTVLVVTSLTENIVTRLVAQ